MRLFSQSILLQIAVILAVTMLLWGGSLAAPPSMSADGGGVLYGIVARWLVGAPLAAVIVAMVLVVAEGLWLNLLLVDHSLTPQNSLLPTLLYIVCMSAPATTLTPMVLAAAPLIACIRQLLLKGTLLTISTGRSCAATAMIGLASLFYLPAAIMIVGYMLAAINYRLYGVKDWAVLFLGFLAPYVLLATVLMFTDGLESWWQGVVDTFAAMSVNVGDFTTLQGVGNAALLAALLAGVVSVWSLSGERTVVWQKNAVTILSYIVGGAVMLLTTQIFTADLQVLAIPFAFCATCLLSPPTRSMRRRKRHEWLYYSLLILTVTAALIC